MSDVDFILSLFAKDEESVLEKKPKPNLLGTVVEHAFPIKKAVGLVKGVGESLYRQMDYMMSLSQMSTTNMTLDGQRNLTLKERVQVKQELALETSKFALYYGGPAGKAISGTIKNIAKGVSPIANRAYQKFLRRIFGEKWTKQQLDVLWNKINSPTAKFTNAEVNAIAEMKNISQTTGTSMGKLFAKEKLWLETKSGIYTDIRYGAKGLQFRPKPPISDKTYELKKILTKPKPTPLKPKPLTPEEIEIIRHPPGRIIKEPLKVPETPTLVPPAPDIEKVITPYVPKKPIVKPKPLVPEKPVTEYAGTAFGERAAPPIITGEGLGKKSPLDVYYPGIGPAAGGLPVKPPIKPTAKQLIEAHKIAKDKLLITKEGKLKPQYRRLAFNMTGKKSMAQMTHEEAKTFIDALKKVSEPRYRKGKILPPVIPVSKKLVTPDFFRQMKFKEPTLAKYLTSQMYYAERLGVKPLVGGMEIGKQKFDIEFVNLSHDVDKMGKVINRLGKASIWHRIGKKIKNLPTNPIARMRNILDRYEEPPAFLSDDDKSVFRYFRNLNRTIRLRSNEVRKGLGLEPILYRKAYVRHVAEATAKEMLLGQYPFPEGLKYWSKEVVGKKIFNPMAFHRKLVDDLEKLWTHDLIHATKSMLWTGLKEIHMGQPLKYLNEALGVVSKDKSTYKLLSPEQKAIQDAQQVIPASTKRWLIDYINQSMKGQETEFDASVNRLVTQSGVGGLFNKMLAPFGRTVGRQPITKVFQTTGRMVIHGVMGLLRPKQLIRNKFQLIQNLALYGVKSTLRGLLPSTPTMKKLITNSLFMKTYTGAEELPMGIQHKLEKANLAPFQWTAISNARQAMKTAYWDTHDLITNSKYNKFGWADPKRTYREPKDFLYPSEREKLLKEMEFGAGVTQYHYIPLGMPQVFRHKALVPFTRLQSWWMNHYFKFNREAAHRAFKGETGYGGKLPWSRRINYFKYLILGGAILNTIGYERSFLIGTAPSAVPPTAQLMIGLYNYAVNFTPKTKWDKSKKKKAEYQIFNALKTFIPGYLSYKDFKALISGEKPIESFFFYTKKGIGGEHKLGYISEIAETIGLKEKVPYKKRPKTMAEEILSW